MNLDVSANIEKQLKEQGYHVSTTVGWSMYPMLRNRQDRIVVLPKGEARLKKFDLPLYQRRNGQYVLHRIVKTGKTYTCIGDNQFHYEPDLHHDQMIAVVTAIVRDGREIPVTDLRYRLYCRFWHASRPVRYLWRGGIARVRRSFR